jgi:hypothetical protein
MEMLPPTCDTGTVFLTPHLSIGAHHPLISAGEKLGVITTWVRHVGAWRVC